MTHGMDDLGIIIAGFCFKKRKKKSKNFKLHWITGPLASLSIECSRQKMRD